MWSLYCAGIIEDVRDECTRYGRVVGLAIPRPLGDLNVPGVGKVGCPGACIAFTNSLLTFQIFVEFSTKEDALKANSALAGRKFANRVVVTSFFPLSKYKQKNFSSD